MSLNEWEWEQWREALKEDIIKCIKESETTTANALNQPDSFGNIPIVNAIKYGSRADVIRYMFNQNKQKSTSWRHGKSRSTLLHFAAHYNSYTIIPFLLHNCGGAYFASLKDANGHMAIDRARKFKKTESINLLMNIHRCRLPTTLNTAPISDKLATGCLPRCGDMIGARRGERMHWPLHALLAYDASEFVLTNVNCSL